MLAGALCLLPSRSVSSSSCFCRAKGSPSASSYLPAQQPLIETVLGYSVAVVLYVFILSTVVNWCLHSPTAALIFVAVTLVIWWKGHRVRLDLQRLGRWNLKSYPSHCLDTQNRARLNNVEPRLTRYECELPGAPAIPLLRCNAPAE